MFDVYGRREWGYNAGQIDRRGTEKHRYRSAFDRK